MQCRIVSNVSSYMFGEFINSIKYSMEELGHEIVPTIYLDENGQCPNPKHHDINIVVSGFRPVNLKDIRGIKILSQTEELWNRREKGVYDLSNGYNRVLEQFMENVNIPRGTDNVVYCPYGYSKAYEYNLPKVEEDIDGYFYGSLTERRKGFFYEVAQSNRFNIRDIEGEFGEERNKNIMRSKIIIDCKASDNWSISKIRCYLGQANKKFILAEKSSVAVHPYVPNKHYIEYDGVNDFIDKMNYWLKHDDERNEFALNAHNDLKENCQFTQYIEKGLKGLI